MMSELPGNLSPSNVPPRAIAVVSGKGGSGKTMIAAVIARILDYNNFPTIIVDADTGTGGMTYYLGLKNVKNTSVGLADVAIHEYERELGYLPEGAMQPIRGYNNTEFFGLGDHERLYEEELIEEKLPKVLGWVLRTLKERKKWLVVDCRGGIDRESIAVCKEVDDIIIIAESDTTSLQATQHLVKVLSANRLSYKLRGFIINKVFDDPTAISRSAGTAFKCQYLYSIPFDLAATRAFFIGEVPGVRTLLGTHTWQSLNVAYPDTISEPENRPWTAKEFREVGLANLDSIRGGLVIAGFIMMLTVIYFNFRLTGAVHLSSNVIIVTIIILGLAGSIEPTRRTAGRIIDTYLRISKTLFKAKEE